MKSIQENSQITAIRNAQEAAASERSKVIKKQEDVVDSVDKKAVELAKLTKLVVDFKSSINNLRDPISNHYSEKTASISTTETDNADNYAYIKTSPNFKKTEFNFSVTQIAKASSFMIGVGENGANDGIDNSGAAGIVGTMTVKIEDVGLFENDVNVAIVATDTVSDIVNKINARLIQEGQMDHSALLINDTRNGKSFIEIRGKEGDLRVLDLDWVDGGGTDNLHYFNKIDAQEAKMMIEGIEVSSASNNFNDVIPGLNLTAKKVNQVNQHQKVTFVDNGSMFVKDLGAAVDAYNKLTDFVNEQQSDARGIKPLFGNLELGRASDLLTRFISSVNGKSIVTLGLQIDGSRNIKLGDSSKLEEMTKDLESLRKIFMSNGEVSSIAGNSGSELGVSGIFSKLPLNLSGKDFTVKVNIDNNGFITAVTASIGGNNYAANVLDQGNNMYNITFADNTPLKGVWFFYDTKAVTNHDENFTVNLTNGIADITYISSLDIVDEFGRGSLMGEIETLKSLETHEKESLDKIRADSEKQKAEADKKLSEIQFIFMKSEMMQKNLEGLLGLRN